jgi:hypothetical protein
MTRKELETVADDPTLQDWGQERTTETVTYPLSRRALVRRINRRLAHEGQKLYTSRGDRQRAALGNYYVGGKFLLLSHMNLTRLGRELGVLSEFEEVI